MANRVKRTLAKLLLPFSLIGTAAGGIVILKEYMGGVRYQGKERIAGKTVIITGANSGIGKATATGLADRGARVIMACRDLDRCEEAKKDIIAETANHNVCCQRLDLASIASITAFAEMVNKYEPHVDILINNAGVMMCPKSVTQDGFEQQLGVNYLGHFLLTVLLIDKLKQSAPSRILNICSYAFRDGFMNWTDLNSATSYDKTKAFCQSQLAKVLFTTELDQRLQGTGVTANVIYPGLVRTNITSHLGIRKSYVSSFILAPLQWIMMKTPVQGAQTAIYGSIDKDLEKVSGKYFSSQALHLYDPYMGPISDYNDLISMCGSQKFDSTHANHPVNLYGVHYTSNCQESPFPANLINPEDANRLWLISEKWMRLK